MRLAIIFLITIFVINGFGMYYDWYEFFWFDLVLHFLGGFFVALLMVEYLKPHFLPSSKITNILILVGATAFIGVVWEFAEYIAHIALREPLHASFGISTYFIGDLDDTIEDLLMDILGAMTIAGVFLKGKK